MPAWGSFEFAGISLGGAEARVMIIWLGRLGRASQGRWHLRRILTGSGEDGHSNPGSTWAQAQRPGGAGEVGVEAGSVWLKQEVLTGAEAGR